MKKALITIATVLLLVGNTQAQLPKETPEQKTERMKWWTEARFGMFCHWGLYAMPARHEWVCSNEKSPMKIIKSILNYTIQIYFNQ
jgi:alpha-L-fucosidase